MSSQKTKEPTILPFEKNFENDIIEHYTNVKKDIRSTVYGHPDFGYFILRENINSKKTVYISQEYPDLLSAINNI